MIDFMQSGGASTSSWLTGLEWSALTALFGTWLGHWLSTKQQERQQVSQQGYDDRTRFHDERLDAAAKYIAASMELRSMREARPEPNDILFNMYLERKTKATGALLEAKGRLTLIAPEAVRIASDELYKYLMRTAIRDEEVAEGDVEGHELTIAFERSVRNTLRVELE